jgi:peptidoglycan/xylan/chitin deacetylase (PgdA/CDA1 family)
MDMSVTWKDGARIAVTLTFDFDAETLWLSRDPANARRPGTLSQGTYGAKVGVPKIIEMLEQQGLDGKATFFVPGWTAEKHTSRVELIVQHGHEVGHHGYLHEWIDPDFPDKEVEALERGLSALKKTVGVVPTGYRSPAGETSENMIALLTRYGFVYDTSLMDDINPYRHAGAGGSKGPIELPWHWSLDDAVYALFSIKNPRPIFSPEQILGVWKAEFQEIYAWGGYFNLVMHPQVIGRPARLAMLREFIGWMHRFPGVWFATCAEIADAWSRLNER